MIKVLVCGIGGAMGANIRELLRGDSEAQLVCGVDVRKLENCPAPVFKSFDEVDCDTDVIIDFSSPSALRSEMEWATGRGTPVVLAATGYTQEDLKYIDECAKKTAVFRTANFSVGVNLLVKLVKEAAAALGEKFDIEIVEKHHRLKADAPSGTALMLADSASSAFEDKKEYLCGREGAVGKRGGEIGLHAVRGGTIVGEHDVIFAGADEVVTLSHQAHSKKVFAAGAISAAKWIVGKPAGRYDMSDIL